MRSYVLKRLGSLALTLLLASLIIFIALEIAPGDVALFMMGVDADPAAVQALREELGLGGSHVKRYFEWIFGMLQGDFGTSYTYRVPVLELIGERAQVSFPLALMAFGLSAAFAIPIASFAALRRGRWSETLVMNVAQIAVAIPNFWLAILMLSLFATSLAIFPAGGFPGWSAGMGPALLALTLPALALALPQAAILTRVLRTSIGNTMDEDYVRTARAKGLSERQVMHRHVLRNAIVPILPIMALQFAFLLAGAIIVETVFYLPGLGRLVFQAITQRDIIVVKSVMVVLVFLVVFTMFVMDLIAVWLDPRLREARRS